LRWGKYGNIGECDSESAMTYTMKL